MEEPPATNGHTPAKSVEEPDYLSYLMRLWRVRDGAKTTWRASLQNALSGETHNFASLDRLCTFLREQTGQLYNRGPDRDDEATTVILMIHRGGQEEGG